MMAEMKRQISPDSVILYPEEHTSHIIGSVPNAGMLVKVNTLESLQAFRIVESSNNLNAISEAEQSTTSGEGELCSKQLPINHDGATGLENKVLSIMPGFQTETSSPRHKFVTSHKQIKSQVECWHNENASSISNKRERGILACKRLPMIRTQEDKHWHRQSASSSAPNTREREILAFKEFQFKWDDAEKWVASSVHSSVVPRKYIHHHHLNNASIDNCRGYLRMGSHAYAPQNLIDLAEPSMSTQDSSLGDTGLPELYPNSQVCGCKTSMKDVPRVVITRDMATQMTPLSNSPTSKCASPLATKAVSPLRHNTPIGKIMMQNGNHRLGKQKVQSLELQSCHLAKLELRSLPDGSQYHSPTTPATSNWSRREDEDVEDVSKSGGTSCENATSPAATVRRWENIERLSGSARYKCEKASIEAWENLQIAKAEAELKKLEAKLEKLRCQATEKILSRLSTAKKRAEEMRAAIEAQEAEENVEVRAGDRCNGVHRNVYFPANFGVCFAHASH